MDLTTDLAPRGEDSALCDTHHIIKDSCTKSGYHDPAVRVEQTALPLTLSYKMSTPADKRGDQVKTDANDEPKTPQPGPHFKT